MDIIESVNSQVNEKKESNIISITNGEYYADFCMADKIQPKSQPWFWPGIIPLHTCTLFAGQGGIGKSQLLLYLAAATSTGKEFQAAGSIHQLPQGKVIVLSGEDDPEYQLTPKLIALGADLSQIAVIKTMAVPGKRKRLLDIDAHLSLLINVIKELGNVKLIIIDPIHYFTGAMRDYISSEVSEFISNLSDMAKENDLAVIMNKHTRKRNGGDSIASAVDEVAGSGAWVNSVRQSWIMHPHPEDEGKVLLMNLKVNIAKKSGKAMAYQINSCEIPNPNGDGAIATTTMEWFPEMEDITADEALSMPVANGTEQNIAKFVIDFLKTKPDGMYSSPDVLTAAIEKGEFKRATYYKVRERMIKQGVIEQVPNHYNKDSFMLRLIDHKSYT